MTETVRYYWWEYAAKGGLVGLLAAIALAPANPIVALTLYGSIVAGFVVAMTIAGWHALRRSNQRIRGRFWPFLCYLILERPGAVYAGVLVGLLAGLTVCLFLGWLHNWHWLALAGVLGAATGVLFSLFLGLHNRWLRTSTVLISAAVAAAGFITVITRYPEWLPIPSPAWFALHLLVAGLLVHLLSVASHSEESELECGLTTILIAVSLWVLLPERWRWTGLLLSILWYVLYTSRILSHVQVLKYVLRGWNYSQLRRYRDALLAFRRALEIDPDNGFAREGLWRVHRELTSELLAQNAELRSLVHLDLCLQRVAELLLQGRPTAEALDEANKLLQLVLDQAPKRRWEVLYWRAVANTYAGSYDRAADDLRELLESSAEDDASVSRDAIIVRAWHLALLAHPELTRRVGEPCLEKPGKRIQAIAEVTSALRNQPADQLASEVKKHLYSGLSVEEFEVGRRNYPDLIKTLDFNYIYSLGHELFQTAEQWQRGAEFLHMAAIGMPDKAPAIYLQLGQTYQQRGDEARACYYFEQAKLAAREIGLEQLPAEQKQAYFQAVQTLAQIAYQRQDIDRAIENFTLFVESPQAGTDTLRVITELYERKGDALSALIWNEKALSLDAGNENLLERKHRYYYSVTPEQLLSQRERVEKYFDVEYCLRQARSLVELRNAGEPQLEWALHLVRLVLALQPDNIRALVLAGRIYHRIGNEEEAAHYFERARAAKQESFASREEEEAWYYATVRLGDYYLYTARKPDLALICYNDYRRSPKSGADTLFKMGQCYEQLGDVLRAAKCYQAVTAYDHPLAGEAYAALARLETSNPST
jgi:tetratricopeptide (TPR) repeat protein